MSHRLKQAVFGKNVLALKRPFGSFAFLYTRQLSLLVTAKKVTEIAETDREAIQHLRALEIQEKWNPGRFDIEYLLASKQVSIYTLHDDFTRYGYISLFRAGAFSFLGSFIVPSQYRGKEYGKVLWEHALLASSDVTGLYANPDMQGFYARSGFVQTEVVRRITFEIPQTQVSLKKQPKTFAEMSEIAKFDFQTTGVCRLPLLQTMINDNRSVVATARTENNECSGYGLLRALTQGLRLSLYASSLDSATLILNALLKQYSEKRQECVSAEKEVVVMDVPSSRIDEACNLMDASQIKHQVLPEHQFHLPAMLLYKAQRDASVNLNRHCYGVASLEVG